MFQHVIQSHMWIPSWAFVMIAGTAFVVGYIGGRSDG